MNQSAVETISHFDWIIQEHERIIGRFEEKYRVIRKEYFKKWDEKNALMTAMDREFRGRRLTPTVQNTDNRLYFYWATMGTTKKKGTQEGKRNFTKRIVATGKNGKYQKSDIRSKVKEWEVNLFEEYHPIFTKLFSEIRLHESVIKELNKLKRFTEHYYLTEENAETNSDGHGRLEDGDSHENDFINEYEDVT